MAGQDIISDKGPPKKEEPPEPKGGKATPKTWAYRLGVRQYRAAMRFAGYAIGEEITEAEFIKACDDYKKVPGNWYKDIPAKDLPDAVQHPDKYKKYYMKKVVK
jgi:hypothetical protein